MLSCMQCVCSQEFCSSGILGALISTEYNGTLNLVQSKYYLLLNFLNLLKCHVFKIKININCEIWIHFPLTHIELEMRVTGTMIFLLAHTRLKFLSNFRSGNGLWWWQIRKCRWEKRKCRRISYSSAEITRYDFSIHSFICYWIYNYLIYCASTETIILTHLCLKSWKR